MRTVGKVFALLLLSTLTSVLPATLRAQVRSVGMSQVGAAQPRDTSKTAGTVAAARVGRSLTIIGTVTDSYGGVLPGALVALKGDRSKYAVADKNGNFSLSVLEKPDLVLTVSFMGMKTKEIPLSKVHNPLAVELEDESNMLEGVVKTGYFERTKESFTGSAATLVADDLKKISNQNILASLQNLDPSFVIMDNMEMGSDPNTMPDIQIRGGSSLQDLNGEYTGNPNQPLFILDGFETTTEKVFDLDMNRVASITILKDAAAKAIYGSKAANGVVVIETIMPQEGQLKLSYNGNLNVEVPDLSWYDVCNAEEKLRVEQSAGRYSAPNPYTQQFLNEEYNTLLKAVREGVDTYWLSQPVRTGIGQKHSVYIEGGSSAMRYGVDLSYNDVQGVMKGSDRKTLGGTINLSYRYRNLMFRNVLGVSHNKADNSPYGSFSEYVGLNPYWKMYDENGNVNKLLGTFASSAYATTSYYYNPMYNATLGTKDFSSYLGVTENFYIEWQALPELKFTSRVGFNYTANHSEQFYPGDHTRFATWTGDSYYQRGSYTIGDGTAMTLSADITANYSKTWGKHLLFVNAGANISDNESETHGMTAWGFLNNRVDYISFAKQYAEGGVPTGQETISREIGIIGAANYSYDNRYLADLSVRSNASSVFGADSRWGTFWSAGIGWNLHHEQFMKNNGLFDQLKLRASIGSTGSQNFNPYQAMATYSFFTNQLYDNISGAYLLALSNDNLRWQETLDINTGFDMRLKAGLNLRFDYYVSNTNNLLIDFTLPPSTGFTSYKENLGEVQNKGFEATMNWQFYRNPSKHAFFTLTGSLAHNTNKLRNIADALKQSNENQDTQTDNLTSPLTRYEEGQSMSVIWAVESLGVDPVNGRELFRTKDGGTTYEWNANDQIAAGDTNPLLRGNFGLNMEYEGFGLNVSFAYRLGEDYYNSTLVQRVENVDVAYNVDRRVLTGTWQDVGDNAAFKRITSTPATTRPTTRFIERKNELTLSSLNFYYDFKWLDLSRLKIERLKLGCYANNLFVLSTVKTERGTSYPFARTFSFSAQVTF